MLRGNLTKYYGRLAVLNKESFMDRRQKIQHLLITYLKDEGEIELLLPDQMTVKIGTRQEDEKGQMVKSDDYCWVKASQKGRSVNLDTFNVDLEIQDNEKHKFLYDDIVDGSVRRFSIV
jgi:hypothetical protein